MVQKKHITAIFKEVNLNILIPATVMQTATISLTIQFLLENHQPKHAPNPTNRLIPYITLTSVPFNLKPILKKSNFNKNMI